MKLSWTLIYFGLFIQSLIFSLLLTPLSHIIGTRLSLIDPPKEGKIHQEIKARSGGIAIFLSFMFVTLSGLGLSFILINHSNLLGNDVSRLVKNIPSISFKLTGLLAGAVFIFIVGIIDDRFTLRPWTKLICQIISTIPVLLVGIRIQLFLPSFIGVIFTVAWFILLINAFNFIDNMDGLSSGIAIIVSFVLAIVSWQAQDRFMTAILLTFAGSIMGFWYFNFIKARLFMGDGGSLFIGYMIAALTILCTYYKKGVPTALPVLSPVIILGVPLFDTLSVLYIRFKIGKPLMQGDTNHFSHRLVNLGMTRKQAVIFIYLVTFCVALAAMPLSWLPAIPAMLLTLQVALWFILIYILERTGKKKIEEGIDISK
jgi:UDP-GlcNAc:undecaprenyl-phosphate/decaprenyl-phosphate GlcNAc-1-phosphate transferase